MPSSPSTLTDHRGGPGQERKYGQLARPLRSSLSRATEASRRPASVAATAVTTTPGRPSPKPAEADICVQVSLRGIRMEFAACATAARTFIQESRTTDHYDSVRASASDTAGLPRLPCEQLYLGPVARHGRGLAPILGHSTASPAAGGCPLRPERSCPEARPSPVRCAIARLRDRPLAYRIVI